MSTQKILDKVGVSKDDYCKALSGSKDKNLERHLKRQPNSFFVNNYFDIGLKAWQKNMYIQPVFKEIKR